MDEISKVIIICVIGFVLLIWFYIAARVITRGVIRSIEEKKKEKEKSNE